MTSNYWYSSTCHRGAFVIELWRGKNFEDDDKERLSKILQYQDSERLCIDDDDQRRLIQDIDDQRRLIQDIDDQGRLIQDIDDQGRFVQD